MARTKKNKPTLASAKKTIAEMTVKPRTEKKSSECDELRIANESQEAFDKTEALVDFLKSMSKPASDLLIERLESIAHAANFGGDDEGFSLADTDILKGVRMYLHGLHGSDFLEDDEIETKYAPDKKES